MLIIGIILGVVVLEEPTKEDAGVISIAIQHTRTGKKYHTCCRTVREDPARCFRCCGCRSRRRQQCQQRWRCSKTGRSIAIIVLPFFSALSTVPLLVYFFAVVRSALMVGLEAAITSTRLSSFSARIYFLHLGFIFTSSLSFLCRRRFFFVILGRKVCDVHNGRHAQNIKISCQHNGRRKLRKNLKFAKYKTKKR